jgi:YidC/Oxa1 family membrane protein insertase
MEKRALLAVILSIVVLGAWQLLFGPKPQDPSTIPEQPAVQTTDQSAELPTVPALGTESSSNPTVTNEPAVGFDAVPLSAEAVVADEKREFIIETETYAVRFSNEGGRIVSWRLLNYLDNLDVPLEMIPRNLQQIEEFPLRLVLPGEDATTQQLDKALFLAEESRPEIGGNWPEEGFKGKILSFTYADGHGLNVRKQIALPSQGYVGSVHVEATRDGSPLPFVLTWAVGLPEHKGEDKTRVYFGAEGAGVAHVGTDVNRYDPTKQETIVTLAAGMSASMIRWAGLESTYFFSVLIPENPGSAAASFAPAGVVPHGTAGETRTLLAARFGGQGEVRFTSVVGPKDYTLLSSVGHELERVINFSRFTLIYTITKYLFLILRWLDSFIGNYGFSIILLTIVIRLAFFPITFKSMISMRKNMKKMQKIQPRVKSIQERYKKMKKTADSQKKMNDEIMGIYKKENVNPAASLGGCLPILLQMPVFIGFYNVLSVTIEMRGAPFILWIGDLSRMDPYYIFPVLMGASWMLQQSMTSSSIPDPMQRKIMGLMPIVFTFMMAKMPSGLVIYWFISNLLGLAQQWIINKKADQAAPAGA